MSVIGSIAGAGSSILGGKSAGDHASGRLVDKAQRIASATTTPFLETSVRMDKAGNILESDAKYIEELIKSQILTKMSEQISGVEVIVPVEQDLINTSKLQVQIKIQPLGYLTWIVVTLGLTKIF